ncbi:hypothetical protein AMJ44_06510 [candidate division WOR-1 bacterium DG_54_3]|uniref:Uncharacterized protein n=1 Tax=candidate division WOR-1 bacterium DG_54_3 TaxID=1703775 RepID=A0A0S7Y2E0_UNCSA|nr:MAG: hypothetical protein AMJ44_06510 [candidate division WOR-1 bacterium DG_54_3]
MPKLIDLLNKNKMTLMAALPKNDPELAEAAIKGGADALQLHINVGDFGDFKSEKEMLSEILALSKHPVGIVPGAEKHATQKEMKGMIKMGFDFFSVDIEHIPSFMPQIKDISKVLALGSRFTIDVVLGVGKYGADAVDAAIIPSTGYGKDLMVGDLQNYISIVISAGIPVIIPTQRSIRPSEVAIIADTGAKGLMLTPVVTGTTSKHIQERVQEFRVAVDDLGD